MLIPYPKGFPLLGIAVFVFKFYFVNRSHKSLTFSLVYPRAGNQGHSFSAPIAYLVDLFKKTY